MLIIALSTSACGSSASSCGSLSRDYLWGYYTPTIVDVLTFVGSFGLFFTLFLLFLRFLPIVAMAEVKAALPLQGPAGSEKDEHHG
jgi:Ni/Fe-hydrogenase subunit HybB-like protein